MANPSSFPPQLSCTLVSNLPSLLSGLESLLPLAWRGAAGRGGGRCYLRWGCYWRGCVKLVPL